MTGETARLALENEIARIDDLLKRESDDAGYQAFVRIRKIWPDIKAALRAQSLGTQAPVAWLVDGPMPYDSSEVFLFHANALDAFNKWGKRITPLNASPPALVAQREALEFCRDFKITDGDGKEVTEDSLHEIRKAASRALNATPATGGETER